MNPFQAQALDKGFARNSKAVEIRSRQSPRPRHINLFPVHHTAYALTFTLTHQTIKRTVITRMKLALEQGHAHRGKHSDQQCDEEKSVRNGLR
jgi:hypothetical protein